jgi:hypothetical protein
MSQNFWEGGAGTPQKSTGAAEQIGTVLDEFKLELLNTGSSHMGP